MKKKVAVLGAGPTGIAAAYTLQSDDIECVVYEKKTDFGGLCGGFWVGEYHFDCFAHMTFSKNPTVNRLLEEQTPYWKHLPEAYNYRKGRWLRNPVQNNLYGLDVEERIAVITDYLKRPEQIPRKTYKDWLLSSYGTYFTEEFPSKYTRKYWTVDPKQLETKWVEGRMYVPSLEEMLRGAMSEDTPNVHYSKEMHYPIQGGFQEFLRPMVEGLTIAYQKEVCHIDSEQKRVDFSDGTSETYDGLISTLPLTEMPTILPDLPGKVLSAVKELDYTSGYTVSIGLNKKIEFPSIWFYIYDEEILPARVYFTDLKSPNNTPEGCSGIQAEIYVSKYKSIELSMEELKEKVIEQLIQMELFSKADVVVSQIHFEKYANIMFTPKIYQARGVVRDALQKKGIWTAGRFGEWDYLWLEQSLLSGIECAKRWKESICGGNS